MSLHLPFSAIAPSGRVASEVQATAQTSAKDSAQQHKKVLQSAQQFETQLLTSLLSSLETSMGSLLGSEESGEGQQYHTMATQGLATAWAAAGGIGIAKMVAKALTKTGQTTPLPEVPSALPEVANYKTF